MRTRIGTIALGAILFIIPGISLAQSLSCPSLTRTLTMGTQGEDVRALQQFLISERELLSDYATGYFGFFTQAAVGRWQKSNGVVTSLDESGLGIVGPRTRAAITAQCARTSVSSSNVIQTPTAPKAGNSTAGETMGKCKSSQVPKKPCATSWQGKRGSDGCVTSWYCAVTATRYVTPASSTGALPSTSATSSQSVAFPLGPSTTGTIPSNTATSGGMTTTGYNLFTYWCLHGDNGAGYWSQIPCPPGDTGVTYGSSANVQEGDICAPEGRQEFIACPYMANCYGGGTYLRCTRSIWQRF